MPNLKMLWVSRMWNRETFVELIKSKFRNSEYWMWRFSFYPFTLWLKLIVENNQVLCWSKLTDRDNWLLPEACYWSLLCIYFHLNLGDGKYWKYWTYQCQRRLCDGKYWGDCRWIPTWYWRRALLTFERKGKLWHSLLLPVKLHLNKDFDDKKQDRKVLLFRVDICRDWRPQFLATYFFQKTTRNFYVIHVIFL